MVDGKDVHTAGDLKRFVAAARQRFATGAPLEIVLRIIAKEDNAEPGHVETTTVVASPASHPATPGLSSSFGSSKMTPQLQNLFGAKPSPPTMALSGGAKPTPPRPLGGPKSLSPAGLTPPTTAITPPTTSMTPPTTSLRGASPAVEKKDDWLDFNPRASTGGVTPNLTSLTGAVQPPPQNNLNLFGASPAASASPAPIRPPPSVTDAPLFPTANPASTATPFNFEGTPTQTSLNASMGSMASSNGTPNQTNLFASAPSGQKHFDPFPF